MDPKSVHPTRGHVLVEITEVLGRMRGKLWEVAQDGAQKDTAKGTVLAIGPKPIAWHKPYGLGYVSEPGRVEWPEGYPGLNIGDQVVFPRDVPKAWGWEEKRYALICLDEILLVAAPGEDVEILSHAW